MSQNGYEVLGVSSKGQELEDVEGEENIRTVALEMTRTISPLKDLKALWNFYKLCKKEKPLMVHSHTPKAGIVGMLGARLAGVPIRLHTVAGLPLMEAKGNKRKILDWVEKLTYRCATKVYPNSRGLHDFILENKYTSNDKLKVIANGSSNGIDTSFFAPDQVTEAHKLGLKQDLDIADNDFVFVFVGRLVGDKGINELMMAFKQINTSTNQRTSKLILVGSPEAALDPLSPNTFKEIETNPNIISVGYQKDVRPYFAISDCLTFPSYREGFPNVVMQAGAIGLPCIVSDINGCNEIIIEGENGTIIPAKDTERLRDAMLKVMTNEVYYRHMQQNARRMIAERYEQRVVWNALLEEYRSLSGD